MGAYLVYLDALPNDAEREVNLVADMRRRSPFLDEFRDELLATLYFEF
jgi:hypothetical protein